MPATIIDSDILIDFSRGDPDASNCLLRLEKESVLAISAITQLELIVGCRNKPELRDLVKFLTRFQILKVSSQVSDRAVELLTRYSLSHGLMIADGLIAATAIFYSAPLISKNQRDFRFIEGLTLLPYPDETYVH